MDTAFDFGATDPQDVTLLGMDTSELISDIKIGGLLEDFDPGFLSAEYLSTGSSSPSSSTHGVDEVPLFPEDNFDNFDNLQTQPTHTTAQSQLTKEDLKRKANLEETGADHGTSPRPKKRALSATPTVPTVDELAKQGLSKEEIKKKRRMMKNRQSASISRRRKKEYLESLESRNRQLLEENVSLKDKLAARTNASKEDLERHKQRIQQLEAENAELRKSLEQAGNKSGSAVRAGTTLMMCVLCFGLFSQNSDGKSAIAVNPTMRTGRTLQNAVPLRPLLTATEDKSRLEAKDLEPVKLEKLAFMNETDSSLYASHSAESHETENSTSLDHEVKKERERSHDLLHASEIVSKNELQSAWSMRVSGGFPPVVKDLVSKTPESSYVLCSECVFVKGRDPTSLSLVMPSGKQQVENGMGENSFIKLDCQVSHSQVLSA